MRGKRTKNTVHRTIHSTVHGVDSDGTGLAQRARPFLCLLALVSGISGRWQSPLSSSSCLRYLRLVAEHLACDEEDICDDDTLAEVVSVESRGLTMARLRSDHGEVEV